VWSPKTKVNISGGKRRLFSFLLLEYNFCLLNWISVDFTPQIQNKQIVKIIYDSMNPPVSRKKFSYQTEHVGAYQVQGEIVYSEYSNILGY